MVRDENNEFIEADASTAESQFCYLISVVRIRGSLYFANAAYFEEQILELIARKPKLRYIIIDAVSINKIDASAMASIQTVLLLLKESGIELWFSRLRGAVKKRMQQEGLLALIGEEHVYRHTRDALLCLSQHLGAKHVQDCPLLLRHDRR